MLQNLDSSLWPQILAHVSLTVRTLRILFFTFVFLFLCPTIFTLVAPVCIVYHVCRLSSAAILFPENKIWKGNCWRLVCSQTTEIPFQQSNTLNLGPASWGAWFCYMWCCKVSDFVTGDVRYLIFFTGGIGIQGEDDSYDFGTGAGFYVDATQDKWKNNYRMYSYVTREVPSGNRMCQSSFRLICRITLCYFSHFPLILAVQIIYPSYM